MKIFFRVKIREIPCWVHRLSWLYYDVLTHYNYKNCDSISIKTVSFPFLLLIRNTYCCMLTLVVCQSVWGVEILLFCFVLFLFLFLFLFFWLCSYLLTHKDGWMGWVDGCKCCENHTLSTMHPLKSRIKIIATKRVILHFMTIIIKCYGSEF